MFTLKAAIILRISSFEPKFLLLELQLHIVLDTS